MKLKLNSYSVWFLSTFKLHWECSNIGLPPSSNYRKSDSIELRELFWVIYPQRRVSAWIIQSFISLRLLYITNLYRSSLHSLLKFGSVAALMVLLFLGFRVSAIETLFFFCLCPVLLYCFQTIFSTKSTKAARKETTPHVCLWEQSRAATVQNEPQRWHHFCLISG